MSEKVKVRIDGEVVAATAGQTILEAARANDKYIPALCYMEGLSSVGACRLCMVEVAGDRGNPAPALGDQVVHRQGAALPVVAVDRAGPDALRRPPTDHRRDVVFDQVQRQGIVAVEADEDGAVDVLVDQI